MLLERNGSRRRIASKSRTFPVTTAAPMERAESALNTSLTKAADRSSRPASFSRRRSEPARSKTANGGGSVGHRWRRHGPAFDRRSARHGSERRLAAPSPRRRSRYRIRPVPSIPSSPIPSIDPVDVDVRVEDDLLHEKMSERPPVPLIFRCARKNRLFGDHHVERALHGLLLGLDAEQSAAPCRSWTGPT